MIKRGSLVNKLKGSRVRKLLLAAVLLCLIVYIVLSLFVYDKEVDNDIPLHDGDVLVDSINVKDEAPKGDGAIDESALVTSDDVSEIKNSDSYFQELRATLDIERKKIISLLTEAEESSKGKEEREKALAEKMQLLNYMEQEKTIETLIVNKGLPECFVVITESGINVTVNTEKIDQEMVAKITEIIIRETKRSAEELVIQDIS